MKITRYFQSCLLVEEGSVRILIDPSGHEAGNTEKFGKLDAVLYTHKDSDHFDAGLAAKLKDGGAQIYANAETASQLDFQPNVAVDGQEFAVDGVRVRVVELPHCRMWDDSRGSQNTGYYIAGRLFHSGDSVELSGLSAEIIALPINGPDISLRDALQFAKKLSAKTVIPVHYDYLGGNAEMFVKMTKDRLGIDGRALAIGESVEL